LLRVITFVSRGYGCLRFRPGIALLFCAGAIALAATGNRHTQPNSQSPAADTGVTLGGQAITIEYNAPSARGRKVEGGLIPYDSWYRLGADAATTLTTDADVMIGDVRVPKGVHTLFLYATANGPWKLIVNKQTGQWGLEYHEDQDLGRVPMKLTKLDRAVETFDITLTKTGEKTATLAVSWGNTRAEVPVKLV
jgi:hypothetical protein